MTASELPAVPYISASMLNRYAGKHVRLIGRVIGATPDGRRLQLELPDSGTVHVNRVL